MSAADEQDHEEPDRDHQPSPPPDEPASPIRRWVLIGGGVVVACAALAFGIDYWIYARAHETTNNATVEARTVRVSPMVSGHALRVHVTDNQYVEEGHVLVDIDPRDLDVAVMRAEAQVDVTQGRFAQAQARVEAAEAAVGESSAQVDVAEAEATRARQDAERYAALSANVTSEQRREQITAAAQTAIAQLAAARRRVGSARAEAQSARAAMAAAEAEVTQAKAGLAEARLRRSYGSVKAPFAGHVTQKQVEPGAFVQPGAPLMSIVGAERWIAANFKETQLTRMRPGQFVSLTIDAFPDVPLEGEVESIQRGTGAQFSFLPPQNATGNWVEVVQRLPVKIVFRPSQGLPQNAVLAPGLSVEVAVTLREEESLGEFVRNVTAEWFGAGTSPAVAQEERRGSDGPAR